MLGANDGIVSTASLVLGVAAADSSQTTIVTAGIAGLVAGAMSMAAGEYVSVSSQRDAEVADLEREALELEEQPEAELAELAAIYEARGLSPTLARAVADELSEGDRLAVHAREELGLDTTDLARPVQAAGTSAVTFATGASLPVVAAAVAHGTAGMVLVGVVALVALTVLGALGATLGGAPVGRAAFRVLAGGVLAMAITTVVGTVVGAAGV